MPLTEKSDAFMIIRVGAPRILRVLSSTETLRFGQIYRALRPDSPATLTRRLKELTVLGLVERTVENVPGRSVVVTYQITDSGREALQHFDALETIVREGRARSQSKR
jgi:DNA-binding HxlR family transcriptional regulator